MSWQMINLRHLDLYTCLFSESETLVAFKKRSCDSSADTHSVKNGHTYIYVPLPFLPVLVDATMGFVK